MAGALYSLWVGQSLAWVISSPKNHLSRYQAQQASCPCRGSRVQDERGQAGGAGKICGVRAQATEQRRHRAELC